MKQRDTQAFLTMQSKSKHQCKLCSRSYVSKQNLIRHVKAKHPGCNTLALIFKCSSCEDIFDNMDTFQTHCAVDSIQTRTTSEGNPAVENISREGTPVTTEFEQGEGLTYSGQWTRFQPLTTQGPQIVTDTNQTSVGASSTASTVLYGDIQEYVESQAMSPTKDMETLPDPVPVQKRPKLSSYAEESKESELIVDRISNLERLLDTRLSKIENQLIQLGSSLTEQMMQNSSSQQLYNKSLAGILQKDIGSVKHLVRTKQSESGSLMQSIVDFNRTLCGVMQSGENVQSARK